MDADHVAVTCCVLCLVGGLSFFGAGLWLPAIVFWCVGACWATWMLYDAEVELKAIEREYEDS